MGGDTPPEGVMRPVGAVEIGADGDPENGHHSEHPEITHAELVEEIKAAIEDANNPATLAGVVAETYVRVAKMEQLLEGIFNGVGALAQNPGGIMRALFSKKSRRALEDALAAEEGGT